MNRIPRKLKKQIPNNTHYCYKFTGKVSERYLAGFGIVPNYHIKTCPFYQHIKHKDVPEKHIPEDFKEIYEEWPDDYLGWCKLINYEIEDQCKSCGLKYGKYE